MAQKLTQGDVVMLDKAEMRDRTRERFMGMHGLITATVRQPVSEHADDYDGIWEVEVDGHTYTVRRGAIKT